MPNPVRRPCFAPREGGSEAERKRVLEGRACSPDIDIVCPNDRLSPSCAVSRSVLSRRSGLYPAYEPPLVADGGQALEAGTALRSPRLGPPPTARPGRCHAPALGAGRHGSPARLRRQPGSCCSVAAPGRRQNMRPTTGCAEAGGVQASGYQVVGGRFRGPRRLPPPSALSRSTTRHRGDVVGHTAGPTSI